MTHLTACLDLLLLELVCTHIVDAYKLEPLEHHLVLKHSIVEVIPNLSGWRARGEGSVYTPE